MSYRSIKTALGETKLELKLLLMFGVGLFLVIAATFWFYGGRTEQDRQRAEPEHGPAAGGPGDGRPALEELETSKERRSTRNWCSSCRQSFSKQPYDVRFILPNLPVAKDGGNGDLSPHDDFELAAVKRFLADEPRKPAAAEPGEFDERTSPDGNKYYYYQPIRATERVCFTAAISP